MINNVSVPINIQINNAGFVFPQQSQFNEGQAMLNVVPQPVSKNHGIYIKLIKY